MTSRADIDLRLLAKARLVAFRTILPAIDEQSINSLKLMCDVSPCIEIKEEITPPKMSPIPPHLLGAPLSLIS